MFGLTNNKILFVHIPVQLYSLKLYLKNLLCVNVLIDLFIFETSTAAGNFIEEIEAKGIMAKRRFWCPLLKI